jgi:hypothetical protein
MGKYVEAFRKLRESPLGDAWDKIECPCDYLDRSPCDVNCSCHSENQNKQNSDEKQPDEPLK